MARASLRDTHADAIRGALGLLSISLFPGAGALYLFRHLSTELYAGSVLVALGSLYFALIWRS